MTAKTKRKRPIKTAFARWAIRYGLIPEDEEYKPCMDAWLAGYRAANRAGRKP